ncbi:MAG: FAD-binding protein [Alphaproteobacteria bacterium]|nr:FAD-binding protein [Alphaproteobacteria bacterium]
MAAHDALLQPFKLKTLTLRNRIMSTAHAPGYPEDGMPTERYQLYHEEKARGGIGLTVFGGSSSVALESPTSFGQIDVSGDRVVPYLKELGDRVHRHGGHVFCQISHLGRRGHFDERHWLPLISPSPGRETVHRAFAKEMEDWDFRRVIKAYGEAARRCRESGLDGVEVIGAAQHLLDSFWTPWINQRTDGYGGSLENRMRFGLEVFAEIRRQVGPDYVVGLRLAGDELLDGGLTAEDCMTIAETYAASGSIDYLNVYQSHGDTFAGLAVMIPNMGFPTAPFLYLASAVKAKVGLPVVHASAIRDLTTAARAVADGHVDLVAMTRAHIADPHIVRKLMEGRADDIRQCVGANYCLDRGGAGGGALCIQNAATSREKTMPHVVPRAATQRRAVVVGGGPGGLEAARVLASRGHRVTLFEAAERLGGQINLAAKATWRENLSGIVRWLEGQVRKSGVEVRLGARATAADVAGLAPDVVVIATGGKPMPGYFPGAELCVTTWDILSHRIAPAASALLYDDEGGHQGPSAADFLAQRGGAVELVTYDRAPMLEMGGTNFSVHYRELYKRGVVLTPDARLVAVRRDGDRLAATLSNEYTRAEEERSVDQVVICFGNLPEDGLYQELRPASRNRGEVDYDALRTGRPQTLASNPAGRFQLFRVGDAVVSRNIHAAIYDSLRLCKDL